LRSFGYLASSFKAEETICEDAGTKVKRLNDATIKLLQGADVIIVPDRDKAGVEQAKEFSVLLFGVARHMRVAFPPESKCGNDISDWLSEQAQELRKELLSNWLKTEAKEYTPDSFAWPEFDGRAITSKINGTRGGRPPDATPEEIARDFLTTCYSHGKDFLLRYYRGQWYFYKSFWRTIDKTSLEAKIAAYVQRREDCKMRRNTLPDVFANLNSETMAALTSDRYIAPCWISTGETARGWLPMANGLVNISEAAEAVYQETPIPSSAKKELSPDAFVTYGVQYPFVPEATCPMFEKYLSEVQPEADNREALQMLSGLSLTTECRFNKAFFLYGQPGTGKSVFLKILKSLVGESNVCSVGLAQFADKFSLIQLTEKLLNICGELPTITEDGRSATIEGIFKLVTSGEDLPVERKFCDATKAPATARIIFSCNELPRFSDRSGAVYDRLAIIPFGVRFRDTKAEISDLAEQIINREMPGVFIWALKGLAKLHRLQRFPESKAGRQIREQHRAACDHERTFLLETMEAHNGSSINSKSLFASYREWATENGYRPCAMQRFSEAVNRVFPDAYKDRRRNQHGTQEVYWSNITPKINF